MPPFWKRLLRLWNGRQPARALGNPLGARGERRAERLMRAKGYRVLARNLVMREGEIDLLMLAPDEATVVLVEVKSRIKTDGPWLPESAITAHKRRKLLDLRRAVLRANRWSDQPSRIDVIAVEFAAPTDESPECRHYEAAIREEASTRLVESAAAGTSA